jgi:molybdate transport system regulatory protein
VIIQKNNGTGKRGRISPRLDIRSKIWLEIDGEMFFSRGRMELFRAVERVGSINRAARDLGISYRKAWGHIKAMEERIGVPLVITQVGGREGGGSCLTPEAERLLKKYDSLEEGIEKMLNGRFKKIFGRFFL